MANSSKLLCKDCKTNLREQTRAGKLASYCASCHIKRTYEWQKANPDKRRIQTLKAKLKSRAGITIDQFNELLKSQNGECAICNIVMIKRRLNVDHCHARGVIRGLLCHNCNLLLGLAHDNIEILKSALRYLEKSK